MAASIEEPPVLYSNLGIDRRLFFRAAFTKEIPLFYGRPPGGLGASMAALLYKGDEILLHVCHVHGLLLCLLVLFLYFKLFSLFV